MQRIGPRGVPAVARKHLCCLRVCTVWVHLSGSICFKGVFWTASMGFCWPSPPPFMPSTNTQHSGLKLAVDGFAQHLQKGFRRLLYVKVRGDSISSVLAHICA